MTKGMGAVEPGSSVVVTGMTGRPDGVAVIAGRGASGNGACPSDAVEGSCVACKLYKR